MLFCKHESPGSFTGLWLLVPRHWNIDLRLFCFHRVGCPSGPFPKAGECGSFQESVNCANPSNVWAPRTKHFLPQLSGCRKCSVLCPEILHSGLPTQMFTPKLHGPSVSRPQGLCHHRQAWPAPQLPSQFNKSSFRKSRELLFFSSFSKAGSIIYFSRVVETRARGCNVSSTVSVS